MGEDWRARDQDVDAIVGGAHGDPFAVLGPHQTPAGWLVARLRARARSRVRALTRDGGLIAELPRRTGRFLRGADPVGQGAPGLPGRSRNRAWGLVVHRSLRLRPGARADRRLAGRAKARICGSTTGSARSSSRHEGVDGVHFAVWAPNATRVSVVGDFNGWDGRRHAMRKRVDSGVWEIFVPRLGRGRALQVRDRRRRTARCCRSRPTRSASAPSCGRRPRRSCADSADFAWTDADWMAKRARGANRAARRCRSTRCISARGGAARAAASSPTTSSPTRSIPYVADLGFTHLELLPVTEHPLDDSWGYQPIGLFAPTARFGEPAGFARFVDRAIAAGLGVHPRLGAGAFPDRRARPRALRRHRALRARRPAPGLPSRLEHRDLQFRPRARSRTSSIANALFWLERYHVDGLRVDAVASMLYLDYSRKRGRVAAERATAAARTCEAIAFLRRAERGASTAASRARSRSPRNRPPGPAVSQPAYAGGLGFGFKWNMGWMHDTLDYMRARPGAPALAPRRDDLRPALRLRRELRAAAVARRGRARQGLAARQDAGRRLAEVRERCAPTTRFMWGYPGKKLLFMGQEFAQGARVERRAERSTGGCSTIGRISGVQALVRDLNRALPRDAGAARARLRARRLPLDRGRRRRRSRCSPGSAQGARSDPPVAVVAQLHAGAARRLPARPAAPGRWREVAQHRCRALWRLGHGQSRRRRRPTAAPSHGQPCFGDRDAAAAGDAVPRVQRADAAGAARPDGATCPSEKRKELGVLGAARARRHGLCARRRPRQPADGADRPARQARGLFRRQVAHHRLRAVERAQLRHPPHRRRDAVQGAQPDPPPAARLELPAAGAQRELRHPAGQPARLREPVVSPAPPTRSSRTSTSSSGYAPEYMVILAGDHIYKMDYELMLQQHVDAGADVTVGCLEVPRDGGDGLRRHARRRRRTASSPSSRSRRTRRRCPDKPGRGAGQHGHLRLRDAVPDRAAAARRGRPAIRATISARTSFPTSSRTARRSRIASRSPACARATEAEAYWRDVGTRRCLLGGQHRPDRRRSRRSTSTTATGRSGPMPRSRRRRSSSMTRTAGAASAVSSLVSGGCIVSGAVAAAARCCSPACASTPTRPSTRRWSCPTSTSGAACGSPTWSSTAACGFPTGLVVGEDPELDAKRFRRTESGVCLITQPMIDKLALMSELKVLAVASEVFPLVKTGGLADVVGALPRGARPRRASRCARWCPAIRR